MSVQGPVLVPTMHEEHSMTQALHVRHATVTPHIRRQACSSPPHFSLLHGHQCHILSPLSVRHRRQVSDGVHRIVTHTPVAAARCAAAAPTLQRRLHAHLADGLHTQHVSGW